MPVSQLRPEVTSLAFSAIEKARHQFPRGDPAILVGQHTDDVPSSRVGKDREELIEAGRSGDVEGWLRSASMGITIGHYS